MELYNLTKKQKHDLEIKIVKQAEEKEEKKEIDLIFTIEGDEKPFLIVGIDHIHNPISNDKFPQLHLDVVDGFYFLLQKKFPENVYLTCWFIQSYENEMKNKEEIKKKMKKEMKKKEVIEIEDGTMNRFFTRFLDKPSKKKLLDNMMECIHNKKNLIFFPIFIELGHFALVVFDCEKQTLTYYDSLLKIGKNDKNGFNSFANQYLDMVVYYIIDYYNSLKDSDSMKKSKVLTSFVKDFPDNGDLIQSDDMPQQENYVDCGVYCCLFGYILSNKEIIPKKFTKEQIYSMRLKIKESLFDREIKT